MYNFFHTKFATLSNFFHTITLTNFVFFFKKSNVFSEIDINPNVI